MPTPFENVSEGRRSETAFEKFLAALAPDQELVGERYLELRFRLRKFFAWKYCRESDLDELVDQTVDLLEGIIGGGKVVDDVGSFAFGVANNVWRKYIRRPPPEPIIDPPDVPLDEPSEDAGKRHDCLEKCLATLTAQDREIILGYYDGEENEKNKDHRKELARRLNKSSGALKVGANRLREKLRICISECLKM